MACLLMILNQRRSREAGEAGGAGGDEGEFSPIFCPPDSRITEEEEQGDKLLTILHFQFKNFQFSIFNSPSTSEFVGTNSLGKSSPECAL